MSVSSSDIIGQQQGAVFRRLCQQGNVLLVSEMLRNSKISIDAAQSDGCTGLWLAAEQGHTEVVKLLSGRHGDINVPKNPGSVTPLYVAAQNGHEEVVAALLNAGANMNITKSTGASPLYIACQQNFPGIVRLLLRSGAQVNLANQQGITPLMIAAFQGNCDCVKLLIEAGADPAQTAQGKNCLEWAQINGHRRAVQNVMDVFRATQQREGIEAASTPYYNSPTPSTGISAADAQRGAAVSTKLFSSGNEDSAAPMNSSWYTPSFLLRGQNTQLSTSRSVTGTHSVPGVGSAPSLTEHAIARYVSKKQQVVGAMTAGAAGFQSFGGVTLAMVEEERRRNEEFRRAISKSITIGAKEGDDEQRSVLPTYNVTAGDEAALFRIEQGWEAHKHHLKAHEDFLRETASEVADSWMFSSQMIQQYQESVNAKRTQFSKSQQRNLQLARQNEQEKKKNPFMYPALPVAKLSALTDFMLKGANALGPPPPLPSEEEEEKLTQPDKYAATLDEPGSPVASPLSFRR